MDAERTQPQQVGLADLDAEPVYGADPYMSDGLGARANGLKRKRQARDSLDHPCPKPLKWMEWAVERVAAR